MTVYAAAPQDCQKQPGSGAGRSAATLVVRFDSDQGAASAYSKGVMGFPTPAQDEEEPGLQQGVATQLGPDSWLLHREVAGHALDVAYWRRTSYAIFFVGLDLDPGEVDRALLGVDGRAGCLRSTGRLFTRAPVAHRIERMPAEHEAAGSIPARRTNPASKLGLSKCPLFCSRRIRPGGHLSAMLQVHLMPVGSGRSDRCQRQGSR